MDPFRNPPADTLAAARLHVQALTECGLPREALLRALLEDYCAGKDATARSLMGVASLTRWQRTLDRRQTTASKRKRRSRASGDSRWDRAE